MARWLSVGSFIGDIASAAVSHLRLHPATRAPFYPASTPLRFPIPLRPQKGQPYNLGVSPRLIQPPAYESLS